MVLQVESIGHDGKQGSQSDKYKGKIYLFYTVFKGGYYAANLVSESPLGPWKASDEILFYRTEFSVQKIPTCEQLLP